MNECLLAVLCRVLRACIVILVSNLQSSLLSHKSAFNIRRWLCLCMHACTMFLYVRNVSMYVRTYVFACCAYVCTWESAVVGVVQHTFQYRGSPLCDVTLFLRVRYIDFMSACSSYE